MGVSKISTIPVARHLPIVRRSIREAGKNACEPSHGPVG